jgi:glycerol-3-phosphate dehydrogenase (NAD(P)+)
METIGIIGAGAWGTALAATLRRAGRQVVLWAYEAEVAQAINATGRNALFLPEVALDGVRATNDLGEAAAAEAVLLVVPAQLVRGVCQQLRGVWRADTPLVLCAKGVEIATGATMTEAAGAALPEARLAVLSGPTFAIEVARGLPTAITLACRDTALGQRLVAAIGTPHFRPYLTDDVTGTEMGGAVKNVLAIACGIVEGLEYGDNARAALITRGLAELVRLAVARGAREATCMGLSGLGDLILTASSLQSRNYSLGVALGQGRRLDDILGERRSVTEGVATAASVVALAERLGVDLPICGAVDGMLHRGVGIKDTVGLLLSRPFRTELGF